MNIRRFFLVVIAAFALRLGFIALVGTDPSMYFSNDSSSYLSLAKNLTTTHAFVAPDVPPYHPETIRTPGYPLFLALFSFGSSQPVLLIVLLQALLGAMTAGCLSLTADVLWRRPAAAMGAGLLMAIDYVIILYSSFIMTEALFLMLFALSMLLFARFLQDPNRRNDELLLSGFLIGFATLVRPVTLVYFLIPMLILVFLTARRSFKMGALYVALFLLAANTLPVMWMARNKHVIGSWTISTLQGLTRAAILEERLSNTSYEEATSILEKRFREEHPNGFSTSGQEASAKSVWATKYVIRHPSDYSAVLMQEAIRLLAGNGMKASAWLIFKDPTYDPSRSPAHTKADNGTQVAMLWRTHPILAYALAAYLAFLLIVYVFAATGLWTGWKNDRVASIWLFMTASYFFLVSIGFGTGARYRIPSMPAVFLLAGLGIAKFANLVRHDHQR